MLLSMTTGELGYIKLISDLCLFYLVLRQLLTVWYRLWPKACCLSLLSPRIEGVCYCLWPQLIISSPSLTVPYICVMHFSQCCSLPSLIILPSPRWRFFPTSSSCTFHGYLSTECDILSLSRSRLSKAARERADPLQALPLPWWNVEEPKVVKVSCRPLQLLWVHGMLWWACHIPKMSFYFTPSQPLARKLFLDILLRCYLKLGKRTLDSHLFRTEHLIISYPQPFESLWVPALTSVHCHR